MAADDLVCGTGDIVEAGMQVAKNLPNPILKRRRREALITPAVKADGRMIPDAKNQVIRVLQEEVVVIRFGAVPGIGKPEVLPHYNAMTVAGFIKGFIADLADPVADHGEIHLAVVADRGVVFARTVAKHGFAESPVAATRDESASVDPDAQIASIFAVGHLADACFEGFPVDCLSTSFDRDLCVVEIRIAVADGPPQFGVVQVEGRGRGRIKGDRLSFCCG